jgi:hypothetical protein
MTLEESMHQGRASRDLQEDPENHGKYEPDSQQHEDVWRSDSPALALDPPTITGPTSDQTSAGFS